MDQGAKRRRETASAMRTVPRNRRTPVSSTRLVDTVVSIYPQRGRRPHAERAARRDAASEPQWPSLTAASTPDDANDECEGQGQQQDHSRNREHDEEQQRGILEPLQDDVQRGR